MEPEGSTGGEDQQEPARHLSAWFRATSSHPGVVGLIRQVRRALPGDPEFGDPLSMAGEGGPRAAARAADRLLSTRDTATREVGLAGLQVWQAVTEWVSRRPANPEVTIVFTDIVGFSEWSLQAGDDATLRLLRRLAAVLEPPLLDRGGHIVKRMGDGSMAVFRSPVVAVAAVLAARESVKSVEVQGYTPRLRFGLHTGRPQRMGSDWLGVDVNIAARVMERATRGGIIVSGSTLASIEPEQLDMLGVSAKRMRRQIFAGKPHGVPAGMEMYQLRSKRDPADEADAER
ncbi:MAG: adenylate/guanylate cyclase domain-containing protein [Mycobacterium sp.]